MGSLKNGKHKYSYQVLKCSQYFSMHFILYIDNENISYCRKSNLSPQILTHTPPHQKNSLNEYVANTLKQNILVHAFQQC